MFAFLRPPRGFGAAAKKPSGESSAQDGTGTPDSGSVCFAKNEFAGRIPDSDARHEESGRPRGADSGRALLAEAS